MASNIDASKPTTTRAFTADVRANFAAAKSEIEALQVSSGVSFTQSGSGAVSLSVQNVIRSFYATPQMYGAVGDGSTDDTAAIQAAIDAHKNIRIPFTANGYKVSSSITVKGDIIGEGILGTQSKLVPTTADFAVFVNSTSEDLSKFIIENLDVDFSVATGGSTTIATNSACQGFKWTTTTTFDPYEFLMSNVTVRNAYIGVNDNSASYMARMWGCRMRYCRTGIVKNLGTTMVYENVFTTNCLKGWSINGTYCPVLIGCANDGTVMDGTFNAIAEFIDCEAGPTIIGFDAENNEITGLTTSRLLSIDGCDGFMVQGFKSYLNEFHRTGGEVYGILVTNNARGALKGVRIGTDESGDTSSDTGTVDSLVVNSGSVVTLEGCAIGDITGGSTVFSHVINGTAFNKGSSFDTIFVATAGVWVNEDVTPQVAQAAVGNVGAGTDDLQTVSFPAKGMCRNGHGLRISAWGSAANNSNPKTVTLNFGSATISSQALTVSQVGVWSFEAVVLRTGTDAQKYKVVFHQEGTAEIDDVDVGTTTQDDGAAITIKCTGTVTDGGGGINNNDIVQEGLVVELVR
jgi:hypothetical protein